LGRQPTLPPQYLKFQFPNQHKPNQHKTMSETRSTTSIRLENTSRREPSVCLLEVANAAISVCSEATRAVADLAAHQVRQAVTTAHLANREALRLSTVNATATNAANAAAALGNIVTAGDLKLPASRAGQVFEALRYALETNDKNAVRQEVFKLVSEEQARNQAVLIPMVAAACQAVGFPPVRIQAASGRIEVCGAGSGRATLDVLKDNDGGVRLHIDANGFQNQECVTKLIEPVLNHLRQQGAKFDTARRKPKPRGAYDATRMPKRLHVRCR
jgi:hypothetical protein